MWAVVSSLMLAGFVLIAIAWIIQLIYIARGDRTIQPLFIGVYILGVIVLVTSDIIAGVIDVAYAELVTIAASVLTLIVLLVVKPKEYSLRR